jgi:hypothetical protein
MLHIRHPALLFLEKCLLVTFYVLLAILYLTRIPKIHSNTAPNNLIDSTMDYSSIYINKHTSYYDSQLQILMCINTCHSKSSVVETASQEVQLDALHCTALHKVSNEIFTCYSVKDQHNFDNNVNKSPRLEHGCIKDTPALNFFQWLFKVHGSVIRQNIRFLLNIAKAVCVSIVHGLRRILAFCGHWSSSLLQYMHLKLYCLLQLESSIHVVIANISLRLRQFITSQHDFAVAIAKTKTNTCYLMNHTIHAVRLLSCMLKTVNILENIILSYNCSYFLDKLLS